MKEPHRGTVSKISSTKITAECKMATGPPVKATEQPGLEPTFISAKKYRIEDESTFHCKETGIKFEMQPKTIIEYSLEYGDDYMKLIQENGYELLGPIFNVEVISGHVSAVYLPHYVCLEGFKGEKFIKFGDLKDGKITLKTPTKIEASYVVLENPTFSRVGAVGESFKSLFRRKKYPFNGLVLIYARVVCPEQEELTVYKIHLYLIPSGRPHVKNLDDMKECNGYRKIDKPFQTSRSVNSLINYTISGEPEADIEPKTLKFLVHEEIESIPYIEINIEKTAVLKKQNSISLRVEADSEPVWERKLTRADIEELTRKAMEKGDLTKNFMNKYRSDLVQNVKNIHPVIDDLKTNGLLTGEQCNIVKNQSIPQDKMRSLLEFVGSWSSKDQITCYEVMKRHNTSTIKKIENGN